MFWRVMRRKGAEGTYDRLDIVGRQLAQCGYQLHEFSR
jgi:hypothetical protein